MLQAPAHDDEQLMLAIHFSHLPDDITKRRLVGQASLIGCTCCIWATRALSKTPASASPFPYQQVYLMRGCLDTGSARRMTALALVQGVPSGQNALTWMLSWRQYLISSVFRHRGWTSTCTDRQTGSHLQVADMLNT